MPITPLVPNQPNGKKTKQQNLAHSAMRRILSEPFEIARTAGEQLTGSKPQPELEPPETCSPQQPQAEASPEERNKQERMDAFRNELLEIRKIQRQRESERKQLRIQEEQVKKQQEDQKKEQPVAEPVTKRARGILAGMAGAIQKKQRRTEIAKQPSN